jgi:hypothetical protein
VVNQALALCPVIAVVSIAIVRFYTGFFSYANFMVQAIDSEMDKL